MSYDKNNLFAKILRGEIPAKKIFENEYVIAFEDIVPAAPVHILVIPKGEYMSVDDFAATAPKDMVHGFFSSLQKIVAQLGLSESGYRIISNHGPDASQSVPHFHMHILGGKTMGALLP